MIRLNGDKNGIAGRYEHKETGNVWTVSKWYAGKGIGARWQVEGPYFGAHRAYAQKDIEGVVSNWKTEGVEKVA